MLLLLAVLPTLFWDAPPATAPKLREIGITHIAVPPAQADAWRDVAGIASETADPQTAVKLEAPGVDYKIDLGGATRAPWLNSNGWQFLRKPRGRFYYNVQGSRAALAAAEAFAYGANALVHTDEAGMKPLADMLEFLSGLPEGDLSPVADIGFIDDGSEDAGEAMNLMVRHNLLFRVVPAPDGQVKLMVRLGSKEFPAEAAKNPGELAHDIRGKLSDERRSVRVYGSEVVVARLTGSSNRLRVQLLNYAGSERKVNGIHVRVLGRYPKHHLSSAGSPKTELLDYTLENDSTEFTLPELKSYAAIDLSR